MGGKSVVTGMFGERVLAGGTALVTGASTGLGRHFAKLLAGAGASLIIAARRADRLDATRAEIEGAGGTCRCIAIDLTDMEAIAGLESELGGVDVLVNNAGASRAAMALKVREADWDVALDTNLKGLFFLSQAFARARKAKGKAGAIVNIASITGLRQGVGLLPYHVSKAGAIQLTKTLALELAPAGIRVNAIAPGSFPTEITAGFWESPAGQAMMARIPQGRLGMFEDLDGPMLLLASDASRYMTGSVIVVDGGHSISGL